MTNTEDALFELNSKKFKAAVGDYAKYDDRAWSFIEIRQQEIENAAVSNEKKANAFDGVLAALYNIFPQSNTAYCQALEKRLAYTDKKASHDLERIAKDAYFHSRGVDFMLYGKIIYNAYELSKDKNNFPYRKVAKDFRKRQLKQEKAIEKENRKERVLELDFYLEDPRTDPEKKLDMINEIIDLVQDKYFGPVEANKVKKNYCLAAVDICRSELHNLAFADIYLKQAKEFDRRAERASIEWEKRRNIPTKAREKAYMYRFRSDNINR